MKKILFIINGLGLGNSTRCHAVIHHLNVLGAEVGVITSGNGLWYFEGNSEVAFIKEIDALKYGKKDGKISITATLTSITTMIKTISKNSALIYGTMQDWKPDVVVLDSDYNIRPIKKIGIPLVALNNSDVVVASYRNFKDRPKSIWPQFYFIEMMDFILHKTFMDAVISPSLNAQLQKFSGVFKRVGPIIRDGHNAKEKLVGETPLKVVVMLSGSSFGTDINFKRSDIPATVNIVGRSAPMDATRIGNVTYHGRIKNTYEITRDADLVVVNGGFSAVSEMFMMKKPMLVVPVPNHAEQWVNAQTIQEMGVGEMIEESEIEDKIIEMLPAVSQYRKAYQALPEPKDGAFEAAEIILSMCNS
jgi:uncharacterized protein (TIGR00661 family)